MSVSILKINTQQGSEAFLLCDHGDEKDFRIQILNITENEAYSGFVTDIQLRLMAAEVGMTYNSFLAETREALSVSNGERIYLYSLLNTDDEYKFRWKKTADDGTIMVSLGEVNLDKKSFPDILSEILFFTSTEIKQQKTTNIELHSKLAEQEKVSSDTRALLNDALKAKEDIEKELYTKFSIVLNNKKRKIRELHETIEDLEKNVKRKQNQPEKIQNSIPIKQKHNDADLCVAGPSKAPEVDLNFSLEFDDVVTVPKSKKQRIRKKNNTVATTTENAAKKKTIKREVSESDEDIDALLENF